MENPNATTKPETPAGLSSSGLLSGVERIAAERRRQIVEEGWTPDHDDTHTDCSLAVAAACYALSSATVGTAKLEWRARYADACQTLWPYSQNYWHPGESIRELEKAGALIAAEIDRLLRVKPDNR